MECVRRAVEVLLTEGKQTADRGISRLIARIKKRRTGATTRRGNKCKKPSHWSMSAAEILQT